MRRSEADGIAQDPSELFDVLWADGLPTGKVKRRADVHRDGDWHRSVHVWVTGTDERGPFLLAQRRSAQKDTWPLRLDATVGGHYRHNETLAEALREVEEEIGVAVEKSILRPLGVRLCASETPDGILDREIQDVFLLVDNRPMTDYQPHPVELDALVKFVISDLLALFAGEIDQIPAVSIRPGENGVSEAIVGKDDFIPTIDNYFFRIAIAAGHVLAGERYVVV
jgi:isopentenyldiphosphate isomerase